MWSRIHVSSPREGLAGVLTRARPPVFKGRGGNAAWTPRTDSCTMQSFRCSPSPQSWPCSSPSAGLAFKSSTISLSVAPRRNWSLAAPLRIVRRGSGASTGSPMQGCCSGLHVRRSAALTLVAQPARALNASSAGRRTAVRPAIARAAASASGRPTEGDQAAELGNQLG